MRFLRSFELDGPAGPAKDWLISPDEEVGCSMRLMRGGDAIKDAESSPRERVAVVFAGKVTLTSNDGDTDAGTGDSIFIPANMPAAVNGEAGSAWVEIETDDIADGAAYPDDMRPIVKNSSDRAGFINYENSGFWVNAVFDRNMGTKNVRLNALEVEDKVGSPDWHIHAFTQFYLIQDGEMTVDIGRAKFQAGPNTLVMLPAGVVHRNYNVSGGMEKHVALLVPEPPKDAIFDYAVTIHEREAEMLKL